MNPIDMIKAAKVVTEFQKDPEKIKEFAPQVVQFFGNILKSANAAHFGGHVTIMLDLREQGPVLHLVNVNTEGQVHSIEKKYLQTFLQSINISNVPGVVKRLNDGNTPPWSQMQQALFPNSIVKPAATLEGQLTQDATEVDNNRELWSEIEKVLPGEYSRGTCDTLRTLLNVKYQPDEVEALINHMKLRTGYDSVMYNHIVEGVWHEYPAMIAELDSQLQIMEEQDTHLPEEWNFGAVGQNNEPGRKMGDQPQIEDPG